MTLTKHWKSLILKMTTSRLLVSHDRQTTERNCLHQDALYLKQYRKRNQVKGQSRTLSLRSLLCRLDQNGNGSRKFRYWIDFEWLQAKTIQIIRNKPPRSSLSHAFES